MVWFNARDRGPRVGPQAPGVPRQKPKSQPPTGWAPLRESIDARSTKLMEPHRSAGLNMGNQSVARLRGDNIEIGIPVSFSHLSGDDGDSPQGRVCPIGHPVSSLLRSNSEKYKSRRGPIAQRNLAQRRTCLLAAPGRMTEMLFECT